MKLKPYKEIPVFKKPVRKKPVATVKKTGSYEEIGGGLRLGLRPGDVVVVEHAGQQLKIRFNWFVGKIQANMSFIGEKDFVISRLGGYDPATRTGEEPLPDIPGGHD